MGHRLRQHRFLRSDEVGAESCPSDAQLMDVALTGLFNKSKCIIKY